VAWREEKGGLNGGSADQIRSEQIAEQIIGVKSDGVKDKTRQVCY
jgi:hypothetical protein